MLLSKKSFTLIEVLVVVFIIMILSVIGIANYQGGESDAVLKIASNKLKQDLRNAEIMSMSTRKFDDSGGPQGGYGIHFNKIDDDEKYILFADCDGDVAYDESGTYDGAEMDNCKDAGEYPEAKDTEEFSEDIKIESGAKITDIKVDEVSLDFLSITFVPPDPNVFFSETGDIAKITLSLEDDNTKTEVVTVNKTGLIGIE